MRSVLVKKMTKLSLMLAVVVGLTCGSVFAHVMVDSPNGNETLAAGSTVTVHWHVVVQHDQIDWDIYYSTTGGNGPWFPIAENLPVGDGTTGAMHTYQWTVPDEPSDQVRIQVVQDNGSFDYDDMSDADLSIVSGPIFVDGFESGNNLIWSVTTD